MKSKLFVAVFLLAPGFQAASQHLNVGITFQYLVLKQVKINSNSIVPSSSYNYYKVVDNRWKFFSAGQSFVVGTIAQLDMKRFYVAIEPSFELNTYNYNLDYPLTPSTSERITFKTLLFQADFPVYLGYQFKTSNVLRYSFFAGAGPIVPYQLEVNLSSVNNDPNVYGRYSAYDLKNILYSNQLYWNALAGLAVHFANLGRLDIRYVSRLGSPGSQYQVSFHSVGIGMTFFLPLHLLKRKIYYED